MHYQEKVKEFMNVFGQECPSIPTIPSTDIRILRIKLLLEEVLELAEASSIRILDTFNTPLDTSSIKTNKIKFKEIQNTPVSLVGIADAVADISYVNYGAANAYGIDIAPVEEEVHNSNMTKLFTEEEVMQLNPDLYTVKPVEFSGRSFLVKAKDGKVQKSPSYTPANVGKYIDQQLAINE
jgi:predicted HAD superfamily Cof-like phosphohydrolase